VDPDQRLRRFIADAKQRREQRREQQLDAFKQGVQQVASAELCDILGVSYALEQADGDPRASFKLGDEQWRIMSPEKGPPQGGPPAHRVYISNPAKGVAIGPLAFGSMDDLLLIIDEHIAKS